MSQSRDPEQEQRAARQTADRLVRETDDMQQRSDELRKGIDEARQDWERKRSDDSVPGANPPESEDKPPPEASFPAKQGGEET